MGLKQAFFNFVYHNRTKIADIYFALFFSWLPVKKNKIVFTNYQGSGYGCNPKYIAEEIIRQNLPLELVWIAKLEFFADKDFPQQIRVVNYYDQHSCLRELATASIWVDNYSKFNFVNAGLRKKKNQLYINTWHGSLGIKRIDENVKSLKANRAWKPTAVKDYGLIDKMISNSDFETNVYRDALWFKGEILKLGHPRNDIFHKDDKELKQEIKKKLGIPKDTKIALYAPSFRDNLRTDYFNLDYDGLKKCLENKNGEKWAIVSRFHPKNFLKVQYLSHKADAQTDASFYPDIQELLYVADILISDYSSCMFDFMLTKRPCFIYAEDIEQYNNERGFYYKLEETPFPIAENNIQLMENINNFDHNKYEKACSKFLETKGALEDGKASKRVVDIVRRILKNEI